MPPRRREAMEGPAPGSGQHIIHERRRTSRVLVPRPRGDGGAHALRQLHLRPHQPIFEAYSFCCPDGSDGSSYDGDGVTPVFSALGMEGADRMVLDGVGHFCWSDVFGGDLVAPELTRAHREGRPWYGSNGAVEKWAPWIRRS